MFKPYTEKQIEEICLAFEGSHGPGLIHTIVLSEYKKQVSTSIDIQKLTEFFSSCNSQGVAKLLQVLYCTPDKNPPKEFGSHTIDFYGVMSGPFSLENASTLVGITIGNKHRNISTLEWFSYLSAGFHQLSELQKSGLNNVCEDFARIHEAIASGKGVQEVGIEELLNP